MKGSAALCKLNFHIAALLSAKKVGGIKLGYIAIFDIGTTSMKGILIDQEANTVGAFSVLLGTCYGPNDEVEQDPLDWWNGVKEISNTWWNKMGVDPKQVVMITFSGQMEDVISIPKIEGTSLNQAILYADTRAHEEAAFVDRKFPAIREKTGNIIRASTPIAKLLWLEKNNPNLYKDTACFVFSAKDFIIYKMTHAFVTDPTTGATTGIMNLKKRQWEMNTVKSLGMDTMKLPKLLNAESIAGYLSPCASVETGFAKDTPVLCGAGDAGASTMGAAAVNQGDNYLYIGTTGWAAMIQAEVKTDYPFDGVFHLAHLPEDSIISISPLLNVGNVHRWAVDTFAGEKAFDDFEMLLNKSSIGSNGVLFLPYLNGERCPVNDPEARGAFWGIGPKTKKSDFARAVIEGICFSLKQLIELFGDDASGIITLIGGGTKSATWCQILADCIGRTIRVPAESEFMPALGASASAFVTLGWVTDYKDFAERFMMTTKATVYQPNKTNHSTYNEIFARFLKLYPSLKNMYR